MPEATYEAWLNDPARAFLNELQNPQEKERALRLIRILEVDPFIDGRSKLSINLGGITETVYVQPDFWIFYHLADNASLVIDAIARPWFDQGWVPPELPPNLRL